MAVRSGVLPIHRRGHQKQQQSSSSLSDRNSSNTIEQSPSSKGWYHHHHTLNNRKKGSWFCCKHWQLIIFRWFHRIITKTKSTTTTTTTSAATAIIIIFLVIVFIIIICYNIGSSIISNNRSNNNNLHPFLSYPRIIYLEGSSDRIILDVDNTIMSTKDSSKSLLLLLSSSWKDYNIKINPNTTTTSKKQIGDNNDKYYDHNRFVSDEEKTGCSYIAEWQTRKSAYPTCNHLHEVGIRVTGGKSRSNTTTTTTTHPQHDGNIYSLKHLDSGAFKDVWRILLEDKETESREFVLKTTVYHKNLKFTEKLYDYHRKDALILEQTTSSDYVLNMYAYCGTSNIVESAISTLYSWIYDENGNGRDIANSIELLQVAIILAQGISDMHLFHQIENNNSNNNNNNNEIIEVATTAHADIKAAQFLTIPIFDDNTGEETGDYIFKINDFNRARFLTIDKDNNNNNNNNKNKNQICPFTINTVHRGSTMRAPEEYMDGGLQTDKIDVYSLGSVLYHLLTKEEPYESIAKLNYTKAIELITSSKSHIPIPKKYHIQAKKDPAMKSIINAIQNCRQYNPYNRPTSKQIVQQLEYDYETIIEKQNKQQQQQQQQQQ